MATTLASLALAGAAPLLVADGDAPSLSAPPFTIERMTIDKATSRHEWPFAITGGELACVEFGGQRVVLFSEPSREDMLQASSEPALPRSVPVSANPFALLAGYEDRSLYAPYDGLESLIRRLAPFEAMGTLLCERDKGRTP